LFVTEIDFAEAEIAVFSNSKNYRRDPTVPLVVPLVNPSHFDIIPHQRTSPTQLFSKSLQKGFILTNANCSTTGIVVPLKALEDAFGPLDCVLVNTMQAISGGGYPGVSSMDILDNVVPYIGGEEEKIEWETSKILGGIAPDNKSFDYHKSSPLKISASCNRVPVLDGHTEVVSCSFKKRPAPSPEAVIKVLREYRCEAQELGCHSAPEHVIFVHDEQDRPQPRLDRYFQNGAGVNVGRVRECGVLDIKFVVLSNNVSIGAATSSIMNAEIALAKGIV
jgi:aspartate-semialdehyde dehydrogenase